MSNYIVDTSIVVQFLVQDTHTGLVKHLFQTLTQDDELIVPEFCILECTNVLWKYVRFHGVALTTAESLVEDLTGLPLTTYAITDYLKRALVIGVTHQLAVYDSVYIALAEQLGYPLITDDARQATAASAEGVTLKAITDFRTTN